MNSITDTHVQWPTGVDILRVLTLSDYNTRVVVIGVVLLGIASGVIGTFMLLRKRALMGDAVSHATLPGIGIAFLVMTAHGGTGRSLTGLLIGATLSGLIGMGAVLLIRSQTRLKEDAALGIVLSVFFGLGIAVLGIVQQQTLGHAAGLEAFIYGKTASMLARDAYLIAGVAAAITLFSTLFFKEFALICFDQEFAGSQGWSVGGLDVLMMALVVLVTVSGLQAVGLILMIALLIIPPAAARFWTQHLVRMVLLSAVIGGVSCLFGAALSALLPRMPAGSIIVVDCLSVQYDLRHGAGRLAAHAGAPSIATPRPMATPAPRPLRVERTAHGRSVDLECRRPGIRHAAAAAVGRAVMETAPPERHSAVCPA